MTGVALKTAPNSGLTPTLSPKRIVWRAKFYRVRGWESKVVEQSAMQVEMATVTRAFEESAFPQGGAQDLKDAELDPGKEFKNYLATLERFEALEPPRSKGDVAAMRQAAQAYLDHFDGHSKRQQAQSKTMKKRDACQRTLLDLAGYEQVNELRALGNPPWDAKTGMKAASLKAAMDFQSLPADSRQAEVLDEGNANTAFWFNKDGGDGTPAKTFLFKPDTNKYSDIEGFPRGAETMREAMAGRTADLLTGITEIRFEVPETHVIQVDPARFPQGSIARPKAQQDQPVVGSLQQFAASDGEMRKNDLAKMAKVPAEDAQKIAVLDIVTMNMDRHAGNLMFKQGQPGLVPIDHGLTFPPAAAVNEMPKRIGDVQNALLQVPSAHEPFSKEMLKAIRKLDPNIVVAGLKAELRTLDEAHGGGASAKVPDDALEISKKSTAFLKMAASRLSPAAVQIALGQNAKRLFDPALDDVADFETLAEAIIKEAEAQKEDWKTYFTMPSEQQQDIAIRLYELGWPSDRGVAKSSWMISNLKMAMGIYATDTINQAAIDDFATTYGKKAVDAALKKYSLGRLVAAPSEIGEPQTDPNAAPVGDITAELQALEAAFPYEQSPLPAAQELNVKKWRKLQANGGMQALEAAIASLSLNGAGEADARRSIENAIKTVIDAKGADNLKDTKFPIDAVETKLKTKILDYVSDLAVMLPARRQTTTMKTVTRYRKVMGSSREPSRQKLEGVQTAAVDRVRRDLTADLDQLKAQLGDRVATMAATIKGWETDIATGNVKTARQQMTYTRNAMNLPRV